MPHFLIGALVPKLSPIHMAALARSSALTAILRKSNIRAARVNADLVCSPK
jgi:hypothetical protein